MVERWGSHGRFNGRMTAALVVMAVSLGVAGSPPASHAADGTGFCPADDVYEPNGWDPNGPFTDHTVLRRSTTIHGIACAGNTIYVRTDVFAVQTTGGFISLEFAHGGDLEVSLYSSNGGRIFGSFEDYGSHVPPGTYFVVVLNYTNPGDRAYTLGVTVPGMGDRICTAPDQNEPNDRFEQATSLTPGGEPVAGEVCQEDTDLFVIEAAAGDTMAADVTFPHALGDLDAQLLGPDGERVALAASEDDDETLTYTATGNGPHFLAIASRGTDHNAYTVAVDVTPRVITGPTAEAGGPYDVDEGATVIVDAAATSAPSGLAPAYAWDLDGDGTHETEGMTAQFSAVGLDGPGSALVEVRVCDGSGACDTDTADVRIHNVAPTADAGADQTVFRNQVTNLTGSWTDPATSLDAPYAFAWTVPSQDANGTALYGDTLAHSATFPTEGSYTVSLAVTDKDDGTASDNAVVTVLNRAPDCTGVVPSQSALWPPDRRMVPVALSGATDAEGDPLTYVVTSIFQDEPVTTIEDDDAAPDGAGVGTATASVRAERAGGDLVAGNGRVYHVRFTVDDGHGGSCSAAVLVGVPHDQASAPAVDDGSLYDSTMA